MTSYLEPQYFSTTLLSMVVALESCAARLILWNIPHFQGT